MPTSPSSQRERNTASAWCGAHCEIKVLRDERAVIPIGSLQDGITPSGDGSQFSVVLEPRTRSRVRHADEQRIATSPVGQAAHVIEVPLQPSVRTQELERLSMPENRSSRSCAARKQVRRKSTHSVSLTDGREQAQGCVAAGTVKALLLHCESLRHRTLNHAVQTNR